VVRKLTVQAIFLIPSGISILNTRDFAIDRGNIAAKIYASEVDFLSLFIGLRNPTP
jgi:hypothetical protein